MAGAAQECHRKEGKALPWGRACTQPLPQGRSDPVVEEVLIIQMSTVLRCFAVFEYHLDPETALPPSLSVMHSLQWAAHSSLYIWQFLESQTHAHVKAVIIKLNEKRWQEIDLRLEIELTRISSESLDMNLMLTLSIQHLDACSLAGVRAP